LLTKIKTITKDQHSSLFFHNVRDDDTVLYTWKLGDA
jgi:hypothetical protein